MNVRTYIRHVGVLLFGNVAAQVVNLASYPVLTRLYSPAEFGGFALFLTAVGILGPVACARFDLPIQSSKNWQLPAVFRQALRMNVTVSVLATAVAMIIGLITNKIGIDLALLMGLGIFFSGYTLAALALLVRLERYPLYSRSLLIRALATAIAQIALWIVLPHALGLILGFCLGLAGQAASLRWSLRQVRWRRSTASHLGAIAARYRRQIMTDIPSTLVAGAVLNIMNVLLLELYSRTEVGYYSLAFRLAVLPITLISGSLGEVFFQKASESYRATGKFWNELRFNLLVSAGLSIFIFGPLGLLAHPIFAFAFGRQWLPSADLLELLIPMLIVRFASLTIQTAPLVIGRAKILLVQHLALLASILAAYATAKALALPIQSFILLSSVLMALVYAAYLVSVSIVVRGLGERKAMSDFAPANAVDVMGNTLAKPDLHEAWLATYRNEAVSQFTAEALGTVVRKLSLPRTAKIFDAGCGSGTNSIWLARQGFSVTGVDFSDFALGKAVEHAEREGLQDRIDLRIADLTKLPFDDGTFDAALCTGVLMHIPRLETALDELVRVIRPGGSLIIAECNARSPETFLFRIYWQLARPNMRVEKKPCGLEVWSETAAGPLLSRKISIGWLTDFLARRGMRRVVRMTGELTELYVYLRSPLLRKWIHALNSFWLRSRGLPLLSLGNILAFRKEVKP